ncbi:tripartite tricarboxylate transporter substrate binding protein [Roseomonas sp. M0104]|uniref:Tripartite tricarboxylate transporter substrate binding protein n=1 Tax=Teichococcus coralli TaxID=2545983 RepID=A0A845BC04_9PROT|nr:tripartite tricarboxylate transporter substrate binding protein [Pseudoroseomonas coralli]MXP65113.1 tripartite tricarboxylate transporter substrate binding protein [Pseudoroseomonas coralli]
MKRRGLFASAAGLALGPLATTPRPAAAQAAAWPNQPVRLVVPFAAGGPTDVAARLVAEELGKVLPQRIIVENRTGAGVVVGSEYVAKAPKDGYTLLYTTIAHSVLRPLFPQLTFDPIADFAPVALIGQVPMVLYVNPKLPAKSLQELITLFREHPGEYHYASSGIGGAVHLATELFLSMAGGLKVQHVPYRGSSAAMPDLLSGNVDMLMDVGTGAMPYVERGELRALGVGSPTRSPAAPDVPAISEAGVPGYEAYSWHMVMAPAGTPAAVITALNDAVNRVTGQEAFRQRLLEMAMQVRPRSSPDEAAAFLASETAKWEPILRRVGMAG